MNYVGIDLGGTNIAVGLVNEDGKVLQKASAPTLAKRGADDIAADMADLVRKVAAKGGIDVSQIDFCGIACPGRVDTLNGVIVGSCNLPFNRYPIVEKLKEMTGIGNIAVQNDGNVAAKGEAEVGAAKGFANSVMVTLGTGVGSGIVIDHKIISGLHNTGAELGHTVIVEGGRPCSCGRCGCWEKYSSARGLIQTTKEKMITDNESLMWDIVDGDIRKVNGRTAFDAMRAGDACGKAVVDEYIKYLACGIANIIMMLAPDVISIGGGVSNEGDTLLVPLKKAVLCQIPAVRSGIPTTDIRIAQLGNDAGIIGAAMLGVNV